MSPNGCEKEKKTNAVPWVTGLVRNASTAEEEHPS